MPFHFFLNVLVSVKIIDQVAWLVVRHTEPIDLVNLFCDGCLILHQVRSFQWLRIIQIHNI